MKNSEDTKENIFDIFEISESEYISLRDEMVQRIVLMNSQATNAITVVLTMWAAGLGLFGIQLANMRKFNILHNLALCFGEVGSFFCALIILIPLAMKSGENLRQLVTLNLYISFFYFELVRDKKIKSKNIYPWEYVSGCTNDIYKIGQKKKDKVLLAMTNAEYPVLGLVSVVFSCCVLVANCNLICNSGRGHVVFILVAILIEGVEGIIILFLYVKTSIYRNMTITRENKTKEYVEFLKKLEKADYLKS